MGHRTLVVVLFVTVLFGSCTTPGPEDDDAYTVEFFNNNAQHYYDGGDYTRAMQQFEKALELEPSNEVALLGQAWCQVFLAEGNILRGDPLAADLLERARDSFAALSEEDLDQNQYKVDLGFGKVHVLYGDLYTARVDLIKSELVHRPEGDPLAGTLRTTEAQRLESYTQARVLFESVLANEDDPGARDNLTALIQLARIAVIQKDYAGALLYAERYRQQVRRSKELWVRSMKDFPEDKPIWEMKLAGAVAKEVEVLDLIANAYYKLGQLELARDELDRLLLLDPYRTDAYLNRGILRQSLGDARGALEDFQEFMRRAAGLDLEYTDHRVIEATRRIMAIEKELGLQSSVPDAE
jgi:tetratricopeptide (TPR) repeat protein